MAIWHLVPASVTPGPLVFQNVLSTPEWQNLLTVEDKRALNVLFHSNINPYGLFPLDLSQRLGITLEISKTDTEEKDRGPTTDVVKQPQEEEELI